MLEAGSTGLAEREFQILSDLGAWGVYSLTDLVEGRW